MNDLTYREKRIKQQPWLWGKRKGENRMTSKKLSSAEDREFANILEDIVDWLMSSRDSHAESKDAHVVCKTKNFVVNVLVNVISNCADFAVQGSILELTCKEIERMAAKSIIAIEKRRTAATNEKIINLDDE